MNPLSAAVLQAGLIDPEMIEEMKRFKVPIDFEEVPQAPAPVSAEQVTLLLEEALQSEDMVLSRETDLQILRQYLSTIRRGLLHIEIEPDPEDTTSITATDIDVTYGRTALGEYIIGWRSSSIEEMLSNGRTYLNEDDKRIYFTNARELFFGKERAFLICQPGYKEAADGNGP